jgi:predicted PurR-regulated permease PerM
LERRKTLVMAETARRALVAALVFVGVVALALALWKVRLLIALLFLAFVISAAMRPGVEWLRTRGVPRALGIAVHYVAFACFAALLLWLVVPRATEQVAAALGGEVPTSQAELETATKRTTGITHSVLERVQHALDDLPGPGALLDPALEYTRLGLEIGFGIFFTLASAAYWIFERDRAIALVSTLLPTKRRRLVADTWTLIDLKLGAYVRGQLILILLVGTVLSLAFWAIGLPYWLLVGAYAGIVEIVPVVGPLVAGAAAVGVGLTVSWQHALAAGLIVLAVRLAEDYVVIPRVLGHAVGLSPLLVLVSVAAMALLFGKATVLLAIPLAAVVSTLFDVLVLNRDPGEEDVPALLFQPTESDAVSG